MTRSHGRYSLFMVLALLAPAAVVLAQRPAQAPDLSLDSLLNTRVSAASKYAQLVAEAPASVTIVTADDIRQQGYRNVLEALEGVRGFYISYDRNYANLGTRGFSRATDYNNRILLLVDGHTQNDQAWGGAPISSELPINLDAIERIEVVRGPGSALYGTSAMFGVINIVTKTGAALDGVTVHARAGSGAARELAFTAGAPIGARGSFSASGLFMRADGGDLFFPELNTPAENGGVTRGLDWERGIGGLATLTWADVTARAEYRSRAKGIPTGAFSASLADSRSETVDETFWGELAARRTFGGAYQLAARAYADRYRYRGVYGLNPSEPAYTDGGGSTDAGAEALLIWDPVSWNRVTFGSEFRHVSRADYYERQPDGSTSSDDSPFDMLSVFAQNELQLPPARLRVVTGLRYDRQRISQEALTPRIALVATPDAATTAKLFYGEAFRSPSATEAYLSTSYYSRNPDLKAERVRTLEIELDRRVGNGLLFAGSLYSYRISNLIDQVDEGLDFVDFRNVAAASARGAEVQLDALPGGPLTARATFTWQRAMDDSTDAPLSNSPERIASVMVSARTTSGFRAAATVRHESGRRTLLGTFTPAFTRTDLNLRYAPNAPDTPGWLRDAAVSVRVTNLFNVAWATPGGVEHRQASIPQDGRSIFWRVDWRF